MRPAATVQLSDRRMILIIQISAMKGELAFHLISFGFSTSYRVPEKTQGSFDYDFLNILTESFFRYFLRTQRLQKSERTF